MCGIVGLSLPAPHHSASIVTDHMADLLTHRGPDSTGTACSHQGNAWIGFRRLAIRDVHPRANQPMTSASGRTQIVFNGEVYNSSELARKYLATQTLRTSGDTEVVLEVIEQQGLRVLPELNGMFAMAILDRQHGSLALVRDRMGMKPLYVYQDKHFVAFASELRSLKPYGLRPDPTHVELFFHFGYYPSPLTFYERTTQVRPGTVLSIAEGKVLREQRFHHFTDARWNETEPGLEASDELLHDAVQLRTLSDVPVGAFLSGGIDSALVAAHLRDPKSTPVPTFTVGFAQESHDETKAARATARELSVPHHAISIPEQDLEQMAVDYQDCYEQPYADTSGLVTMLLCKAVKQHVTVALSGDGGDEFFGGYARYGWFRKALQGQRLPSTLRHWMAHGTTLVDRRRGHRLARWLRAGDAASLYSEVIRNWHASDVAEILTWNGHSNLGTEMVREVFDRTSGDVMSKAACFDATYYIPDDLQVKLDRASMRESLEVRCPLLDFRVAELGQSLTHHAKFRRGPKSFLKRLLARRLASSALDRPKQGFSVPLAGWLAGPLKDLVDTAFQDRRFRESGWLNADTADRVWASFQRGQSPYAHNVWMLFTLSQHLGATQSNPLFDSLRDERGFVFHEAA